jgi:hypothetical protein
MTEWIQALDPGDASMFESLRRVKRSGLEGHVYVTGFSDGLVKVGQSVDPWRRVSQHARDAISRGSEMLTHWISPPHTCWSHSERLLINFCSLRSGAPARGHEYFAADFNKVVGYAQGLPFPLLTTEELDAAVVAHIHALRNPWSRQFLRRLQLARTST